MCSIYAMQIFVYNAMICIIHRVNQNDYENDSPMIMNFGGSSDDWHANVQLQ